MTRYSVARLEDIAEIDDGQRPFRPIRHHFGIMTFGVNAMTARHDGDPLINEHEHAEVEPESSEELYFVVSGRATFRLDGTTHEAPAGTLVHVSAGVKRSASGDTAGTTLLAIGAGPQGRPYEPGGWELFAPLFPLFDSEDWEEGADRAAALLADDPPYGAIYYNTACFESRAGRLDAAILHLRRAIELAPSLSTLISDDEDLAPLHERSEFAELSGR